MFAFGEYEWLQYFGYVYIFKTSKTLWKGSIQTKLKVQEKVANIEMFTDI